MVMILIRFMEASIDILLEWRDWIAERPGDVNDNRPLIRYKGSFIEGRK